MLTDYIPIVQFIVIGPIVNSLIAVYNENLLSTITDYKYTISLKIYVFSAEGHTFYLSPG